ncbi:thiamine phosphate synthase [Weissella koreensis]|uniref:thiamine phosphate synthase n=1 Tax=Weissella koreensis TaxID=165096 RepID=UPI0022BA5550|nr:thiamine phosphate synthase [Weissella koreensis]MCZ9310839.1 thiamine phosphate synthase [Weissella koreensis]
MKIEQLQCYLVAGPQDYPELSLTEFIVKIEVLMQSGITAYQFRDKGTHYQNCEERLDLVLKLQSLAKKWQVLFIINDDVDLAQQIHADGLHVGQGDQIQAALKVPQAVPMVIGLSVSNASELAAAQDSGADYLGIGPIFATQSKTDAAPALGLAKLAEILPQNHLPIVGIGGITESVLSDLAELGLNGVAVISMLTRSDNPIETVQKIKEAWHGI